MLCTNQFYKYNYKKSKFIWILTDGTASDQLTLLSNYEKYKITSPFLIKGDEITYKHTNELHQTLITGKHNRNIIGKEINFDNIIQQLINSGYKINYRGWGLPIPDIIGDKKNGKKENKMFYKKYIDNSHEITAFSSFCNITNPFPFIKIEYDKYQNPIPNNVINDDLLDKVKNIINDKSTYLFNKEAKIELYEELDELFIQNPIDLLNANIDDCLTKSFSWNEDDDISILYYTTEVDHYNHIFGKSHIYNVLQMYITEKMIENIIEWINVHDDYALIVNADHGGQLFFGEDAIRNHGENVQGNEGIFFIYTKELKDHYNDLKMKERSIHMSDANEIIAQILLDINIPLYSKGFPINLINDDINIFISLKMKEIQLIKLIEKYIEKYTGYKNDLIKILDELKNSFSGTNSFIHEYNIENKEIDSSKKEQFKDFIKNYKKLLSSQQEKIMNIIDKKKSDIKNIILFIFITIFIVIKFNLEIYFLYFKIFENNKTDIKNKNYYILIYAIVIVFLLCKYISISINMNNSEDCLRNGILLYCFLYAFIILIVLLIITFFVFNCDNNSKVFYLIISIFVYSIFCRFISYSNFFLYLKKNFLFLPKIKKMIINLFSFYFLLFALLIKEIYKYRKKNYFFYFCGKTLNCNILLYIYILFIICLFVENCTLEDCYEQNKVNQVFVCFNFIFFIFFFIISNFVVYEATNPEENNIKFIVDNSNNSINKLNEIGKNQKLNINKTSKENMKNKENKENKELKNDIDKNQFLHKRRVNGLPFIKIFLLFTFFWISDESQKLIGLLILLPFLEILNHLSNYYYTEINEIINKKKKNDFIEAIPDEISNAINDVNDNQNEKKKGLKIKNVYIYYFIFYIIIQDMFIMANQNAFGLMKYSFGLELDTVQQSKTLYVLNFIGPFFGNVSFYRYSFILLGFYLEKDIYDKKEIIQNFSLDFIIRKILLNIKIDTDIIYLFYQILININDKLFIDLLMHFLVNFALFFLDYLGFFLTKLFQKIFP